MCVVVEIAARTHDFGVENEIRFVWTANLSLDFIFLPLRRPAEVIFHFAVVLL